MHIHIGTRGTREQFKVPVVIVVIECKFLHSLSVKFS